MSTSATAPRSYTASLLPDVSWTRDYAGQRFQFPLAASPCTVHICDPERDDLDFVVNAAAGYQRDSELQLAKSSVCRSQIVRIEVFRNVFLGNSQYAEGLMLFSTEGPPVLHVAGFAHLVHRHGQRAMRRVMTALGAHDYWVDDFDRSTLGRQIADRHTRRYHVGWSREKLQDVGDITVAQNSGTIPVPEWHFFQVAE